MSKLMRNKRAGVIYILIASIAFTACSSSTSSYRAPITDASPIPTHRIQKHHVSKGETLYSIAWKYNVDYKRLAKANKLDAQYRIWPGQVLTLDLAAAPAAPKVASKAPTKSTWQTVKSSVGRLINKTEEQPKAVSEKKPVSSVSWVWPASGALISKFDDKGGLNKGIDIGGKLGEPVVAAADGEVVYSGSGLRGYGKLLIVKHSEKVLSAYAHNRVLHVAEGDKVKAGQKIAQIGHSGTQMAKLHFEIRYDGTPVNPLSYLPQR